MAGSTRSSRDLGGRTPARAGYSTDLDEALGWASKVTRVISSPIEVWPFANTAGG